MVKVGDKVRSSVYKDIPKGSEFTVSEVRGDGSITATSDNGNTIRPDDYRWPFFEYEYEPITDDITTFGDDGFSTIIQGVIKTFEPNHLRYFTMNALVEAVSNAIDAGDTQSARAIIDAMEAKQ